MCLISNVPSIVVIGGEMERAMLGRAEVVIGVINYYAAERPLAIISFQYGIDVCLSRRCLTFSWWMVRLEFCLLPTEVQDFETWYDIDSISCGSVNVGCGNSCLIAWVTILEFVKCPYDSDVGQMNQGFSVNPKTAFNRKGANHLTDPEANEVTSIVSYFLELPAIDKYLYCWKAVGFTGDPLGSSALWTLQIRLDLMLHGCFRVLMYK
ncbi:hypothetical protein Tco_0619273 [Tanacetum coccineum]